MVALKEVVVGEGYVAIFPKGAEHDLHIMQKTDEGEFCAKEQFKGEARWNLGDFLEFVFVRGRLLYFLPKRDPNPSKHLRPKSCSARQIFEGPPAPSSSDVLPLEHLQVVHGALGRKTTIGLDSSDSEQEREGEGQPSASGQEGAREEDSSDLEEKEDGEGDSSD